MLKRLFALLATVLIASCLLTACSNGDGQSSEARLVNIGAELAGPEGATASVVARGLKNISSLAEDPQGRLWVATAAFTDTGTDGLYLVASPGAAPVMVAPGLHTPMGLLWVGDRLFISSAEGLLVFEGFDGTSFASQQTVATFSGAGILGQLVQGPDGRIRVGISAPCDSCDPDSQWAASVVSLLPDGTDARVESAGIRAPVGLAYVPGTYSLLITMNQRDDLGDATPGDYLAEVTSGQDWGFPACYGQGGSDCAGVPKPISELDKHAAISGVAVVSESTGPVAYVAEWATGKVMMVRMEGQPGRYSGKATTFVSGIQSPVPVIASGGNALLIGDWYSGTVYRVTLPLS